MTEYPRKGDRVKVTLEGVVTKADDRLGRFVEVDGERVATSAIEVLERTFKPGTIVSTEEGTLFRAPNGWVWWDGLESMADDDTVAAWFRVNPSKTKIVYEPPA